jgi:hypothetical protein
VLEEVRVEGRLCTVYKQVNDPSSFELEWAIGGLMHGAVEGRRSLKGAPLGG